MEITYRTTALDIMCLRSCRTAVSDYTPVLSVLALNALTTFFHACFRASLLLPSCRLLSITFTSVFITSVKRNRSRLLKFLLLFFLSMALSSRTSPRHNHSRRSDVANRNAPVQLGRQASRSGFGPAVSNLRFTSRLTSREERLTAKE